MLPFRPQYRAFLLAHNGGSPEPDIFETIPQPPDAPKLRLMILWFYPINDTENGLVNTARVHSVRIVPDFITVAVESSGSLICLGVSESHFGQVYFWDHEEMVAPGQPPSFHNMYFMAHSFAEFLDNLHEDPDIHYYDISPEV